MKQVCGNIDQLARRIATRGATLDSIAPAVLRRDGETVCVDVDHPAYPKPSPTERSRRSLLCKYRGEEIDRVRCLTCSGTVFAKVLQCQVHGRCSLFAHPIDGVRQCSRCPDRRPPLGPANAGGEA